MELLYQHLTESYNREKQQISEHDYDKSYIISVDDVLKAHYLICEYFENETGVQSLYGVKSFNLLSSAVARQSVSLGSTFKYKTNIDKAATVFYGLVKNHAFHDGNKRTALLSLLYFLHKIGRVPTEKQKEFEKLTEVIAADNYGEYKQWKSFSKNSTSVDTKVEFISKMLSKLTIKRDETYRALTYRELRTAIRPYGFDLEPCGTQEINLIYKHKSVFGKDKSEKIYQIGFKGWTRQVFEKSFKCIFAEINKRIDIDAGTILRGGEPLYRLIESFEGPLSRLKDK